MEHSKKKEYLSVADRNHNHNHTGKQSHCECHHKRIRHPGPTTDVKLRGAGERLQKLIQSKSVWPHFTSELH